MSEGHLSLHVGDATKVTPTPLTTTIPVPSANTSETLEASSPTSPTDLATVVETRPPVALGGPAEGEDRTTSEASSNIQESTTEKVELNEGRLSVTADEPFDESAGNSGNEESFGTPEAKVQSLPSPELSTIPLSPADASATTASEPSEIPAASVPLPSTPADAITATTPGPTKTPTSPKPSTQAKPPALASPKPQPATPASPKSVSTKSPSTSSPTKGVSLPAPLDSLLSPTETEGKFSIRDSVAASEATDDEARFSTVLLSARQSLATSPKATLNAQELHTVDEGTGSDENTLVEDWRQHKKTVSNSTILSANNVPYLLSKLSEAEEGEDETSSRPRPVSLQGTQAIKDEFYQRHEEEARGQAEVDWGASRHYFFRCGVCNRVTSARRFLGSRHQWYLLSTHTCGLFAQSVRS